MNFFQSLLSDDPDPPVPEKPQQSDHNAANDVAQTQSDNAAGLWNFGGLIKDLTTRSESVIESYRRDLEEFGSGLKKETEILREAASKAVKDLPTSLEAAQGALDGVLKSTAEIISIDKLVSDGEIEKQGTNRGSSSGRYSWFESQLSAIQSDLSTFCEDPEDVEEFNKWRLGFELESKGGEIEGLIGEDGKLEGVYERVVPSAVDEETFWCRYFYRVEKLKQQETVRLNLVKRAIPVEDDEEEYSWDVDDDDYEEGDVDADEETSGVKAGAGDGANDANSGAVEKRGGNGGGNLNGDNGDSDRVIESDKKSVKNVPSGEKEVKREEVAVAKSDEKGKPEEITEEKNDVKVKSEESAKEKNDAKAKSEDIAGEKSDVKVESEELAKEKNDANLKSEELAKEKNDVKVNEEVKGEHVAKSEGKKSEEIVEEKNEVKVNKENKSESVAKSPAAVVSSSHSKGEEEDLDWDEIEDTGSGDEKKVSAPIREGSPKRVDLRKRLTVAEDDEDLSWDIEDDDQPVK